MAKILMHFRSEDDLPYLPLIGFGSQGAVYQWNDEVAIKYFAYDMDPSDRDLNKFEYFQSIKMTDFAFPEKLVFVGNRFYGYTMPLFKGFDLSRKPFKKDFELLKKAILRNEKNGENLSQYKIQFYDMYTANLIFLRNFKFIDLDSYNYIPSSSFQECLDYNQSALNYVCKEVVREGLNLNVYQNENLFSTIQEKLNNGDMSAIEYINQIQKFLSETAGEEVKTLGKGARVLSKVKRL